jgi:hypothetical protein
MPSRAELDKHFRKYDRRATLRMRELRREGRNIATPTRTVMGATKDALRRRAVFAQRKSLEVLNRNQPLKDARGFPTPAAMQFKRWAFAIPKTRTDVRKILRIARNYLGSVKD